MQQLHHYQARTRVNVCEATISWSIENFSFINVETGSHIQSQKFFIPSEDEYQWSLKLYPYGKTEESKDYVSIFLHCTLNEKDSVIVNCAICMRSKDGRILQKSECFLKKFHANASRGWPEFIERNKITSSLQDDTLIIDCTIKWETDIVETFEKPLPEVPDAQNHLSNDLKQMMDKGSFSDVTLIANNGTKFPAHKVILAARSPVFAAMFEHEMKETKESVVEVQDLSPDTLKSMLEYVYSGTFNKEDNEMTDLLAAADKYALNDLKILCEHELCKKLDIENVIYYLSFSDQHNADFLKKQVLTFITRNLNDVLETEAMKTFLSAQPLCIDIFKALLDHQ